MQTSLFDLIKSKKNRTKIKVPLRFTYVWKGEDWDINDIISNTPAEIKYSQWLRYIFGKAAPWIQKTKRCH